MVKDTTKRIKRQVIDREEMFADNISLKNLYMKYKFLKISNKEITN